MPSTQEYFLRVSGGSPPEEGEIEFSPIIWSRYLSSPMPVALNSSDLDRESLNNTSAMEYAPSAPNSPEAFVESGISHSLSPPSVTNVSSDLVELILNILMHTEPQLPLASNNISADHHQYLGNHIHPSHSSGFLPQSLEGVSTSNNAPIPIALSQELLVTASNAVGALSHPAQVGVAPPQIPPGYVNTSPAGTPPIYKMKEIPEVACPLGGCEGATTLRFSNYHATKHIVEEHAQSHPELARRLQTLRKRGVPGGAPKVACPVCARPRGIRDFGRHLLIHVVSPPPNYWCQVCTEAVYMRDTVRFRGHVEKCARRRRG